MEPINLQMTKDISEVVSTPFYILDETCLINNYNMLLSAFKDHYPNTAIAYACKANNCQSVLALLSRAGAHIEASSNLEYQGIIDLDHEPDKIIFNGPIKADIDWLLIQKNNSVVNIDSIDEINHLCAIASMHPHKEFRVGLRLRLPDSRFGIPVEIQTLNWLKDILIQYPNIKYVSLHGHANCKKQSLSHFVNLTKLLIKTAADHFPDQITSINLGGGILNPDIYTGLTGEPIPSWQDYALQISNAIHENHWARETKPKLYLEPGAALVVNAFKMVTKVIKVEKSNENSTVTIDSSCLQVKPTKHKFNMPFALIKCQPDAEYASGRFNVFGPTCWEEDIIMNDVNAEIPQKGDFLMINHVGAYTISLMPRFIIPAPAVIAIQNNTFKVLHPRQSCLHPTQHL